MKRTLLAATILAVPVLAAPHHAAAQPIQGLYVGAGAGANFLSDERVRSTNFLFYASPGHPASRLSYDTGYAALGSVGWGFGNGVRVEVEGSFRHNDQDLGPTPPGVPAAHGIEEKTGAMANVLFDMDIGSRYVFPYLGAGAGVQAINQDTTSSGPGGLHPFSAKLSGAQGHFAYQAIAGAAFPIPGVVGLSATAEYRYLGVNDNRSDTGTVYGIGATGAPLPLQRRVTQDNNHSLLIGLRYAFNVVPPAGVAVAPSAVPAPAAARSFLVFFDWDRADLSPRGREIIAQAAQSSASASVTRIEVDGHADASGTPGYNLGLSRRRADSVAAELVRDGVPRAAISVLAFGDTHPLVPTAAGVREPQNRRVEIILK